MYPNFGIVIRIKVCLDVCPNLTHHKDLSPYPQEHPLFPALVFFLHCVIIYNSKRIKGAYAASKTMGKRRRQSIPESWDY